MLVSDSIGSQLVASKSSCSPSPNCGKTRTGRKVLRNVFKSANSLGQNVTVAAFGGGSFHAIVSIFCSLRWVRTTRGEPTTQPERSGGQSLDWSLLLRSPPTTAPAIESQLGNKIGNTTKQPSTDCFRKDTTQCKECSTVTISFAPKPLPHANLGTAFAASIAFASAACA